jgi:DNA-directed RNA polymerase specialized sigma subunit
VSNKETIGHFEKMYNAHEINKIIADKMSELELTAKAQGIDNTKDIEALRGMAEKLLKDRAKFDLFFVRLDKTEQDILNARYENHLPTKEIAAIVDYSCSHINLILNRVMSKWNDENTQ